MTSGWRGTVLRIAVSFLAIGCIFYFMRGKIGEAWGILRGGVSWQWFFVAVLTYFVANLVLAARLMLIFKTQNIYLSYGKSLYLSLLGLFFNLFLPSAIGGDVAKIYFAAKYSGKKIEATSAIIQDRLIGFVGLMLLALCGIGMVGQEFRDPRIVQMVYFFIGMMFFTVLFFGSRRFASRFSFLRVLIPSEKLKARLTELYHAMSGFKHHTVILVLALAITFFAQVFFILVHYLLARSLAVEINIFLFFFLVPVVAIVSMMPSLGGLGVREAGVLFFFKHFMGSEKALVFSLLLFVVIYGTSLGSGILYALRGGLKSETIPNMEALKS